MNSYIPKDWRIWFALGVTFFWFCFLIIYIARNVGWGSFLDLPIEEMGTFLEGAFAFLAFLWLVVGLFIQQSVLAENNKELQRNNLHSEKQAHAIAATEMNARQETFFKIAESTHKQLGSIVGLLFLSSQGPAGNNSYTTEKLGEIWKQFAGGDSEIFSRMFLTMPSLMSEASEVDFVDLFYGTGIRRRHTDNFLVGFDRLVALAKGCDTDKIILDTLINSAHGLLNLMMRELHPDIKFEPIVGTDSIQYLDRMINAKIESS